jgi:hypothetical protein
MIVREAYRDVTHSVCSDHWHGHKPLPSDAPALGEVQDARNLGACECCADYVLRETTGAHWPGILPWRDRETPRGKGYATEEEAREDMVRILTDYAARVGGNTQPSFKVVWRGT